PSTNRSMSSCAEPASPADVGHADPRLGERLDQRINQPLAELVKRYEPVAGNRAVAPAITNRHAIERQPSRPDRAKRAQHEPQYVRRPQLAAPRQPVIVETAEPSRLAKHF